MEKQPLRVLEECDLTDWERAMLFQNIQRTRLSNERNFLNWVRASMAFITLGFVMHRFELLVQFAPGADNPEVTFLSWLPMLFFCLGGIMVALGTWEFFRVRKEINDGRWYGLPIIRDALIITTLVSLVVVAVVFVLGNL